MRGAIRKRVSANAPLRRALVAVNCAFRAVCFRNPPRLLRSASSSQKVLRYFLGALLFFVFFGRFGCCDVCLYRRRADGVPRKSASAASDFLGLERRRLYIYTGTRRKPTGYSNSTKRYSKVHKSIYRFIYIQAHVASPQGILTVQKGIQTYTKISIVLMPVFFSSKCHEKRQVSRIKTCLSMGDMKLNGICYPP